MPLKFGTIPKLTKRDIKRFWSKVALTANPDKCWDWTGRTTGMNYGHFDWGKTTKRNGKEKRSLIAHRVAYFLMKGEIPEGKMLMHSCDNPRCCNVNHLIPGTHKDNADDMVKKGRHACMKGINNANAMVTEEDVREIRRLHTFGNTDKQISHHFNLTPSGVKQIISRRSWKHVL